MSELIIWTYDWVSKGPRGFVRDLRLRWACEEAELHTRLGDIGGAENDVGVRASPLAVSTCRVRRPRPRGRASRALPLGSGPGSVSRPRIRTYRGGPARHGAPSRTLRRCASR